MSHVLNNREKIALRAIQISGACPEGKLTATHLAGLMASSPDVARRMLWSLRDKGYICKKKSIVRVLQKGIDWLSLNGPTFELESELATGDLGALTARQSMVMTTIVQFAREWFAMPTYDDIADEVGMSQSGVEHHIALIIKKGWLVHKGKQLALTKRAKAFYNLYTMADPIETFRIDVEKMNLVKGDILVVRFPREMAPGIQEHHGRMIESVRRVCGKKQKVIFLEKELCLEKTDKETIRAIWKGIR